MLTALLLILSLLSSAWLVRLTRPPRGEPATGVIRTSGTPGSVILFGALYCVAALFLLVGQSIHGGTPGYVAMPAGIALVALTIAALRGLHLRSALGLIDRGTFLLVGTFLLPQMLAILLTIELCLSSLLG